MRGLAWPVTATEFVDTRGELNDARLGHGLEGSWFIGSEATLVCGLLES